MVVNSKSALSGKVKKKSLKRAKRADFKSQKMADQDIQEEHSVTTLKEEYYQLNTADGNTIVLSSEQLQQMQDGMMAAAAGDQEAQYVDGIVGEGEEHNQEGMMVEHEGDPNGEVDTQQIHIDADGNIITSAQMHDLVTFHSMDAQGNIITSGGGEDGMEEMTEQVLTENTV